MTVSEGPKKENYRNIYRLIYERGRISKQMAADDLGLSLPTVSKNLEQLLEEEKIIKDGEYPSGGGRPSVAYAVNRTAGIAVGVELRSEECRVAAVDLCGEIIRQDTLPVAFEKSDLWFRYFGDFVTAFAEDLPCRQEQILGVVIAVQGLVSADGEKVIYSKLLSTEGLCRDDFSSYLQGSFRLVHDAEAAGTAEVWRKRLTENALYLSLNQHLGSALIENGKVVHHAELGGGIAEHMKLYPGGRICYCGQRGCAEAYLGASVLTEVSGSLSAFFSGLRSGKKEEKTAWDQYLSNLAFLISNVRMLGDYDVILGGEMEQYLIRKDIVTLMEKIRANAPFAMREPEISEGYYREHAALIGAGLILVEEYLKNI